jgi:hypothetical protein
MTKFKIDRNTKTELSVMTERPPLVQTLRLHVASIVNHIVPRRKLSGLVFSLVLHIASAIAVAIIGTDGMVIFPRASVVGLLSSVTGGGMGLVVVGERYGHHMDNR